MLGNGWIAILACHTSSLCKSRLNLLRRKYVFDKIWTHEQGNQLQGRRRLKNLRGKMGMRIAHAKAPCGTLTLKEVDFPHICHSLLCMINISVRALLILLKHYVFLFLVTVLIPEEGPPREDPTFLPRRRAPLELTRRCGVLLTWHVSSSALKFFYFVYIFLWPHLKVSLFLCDFHFLISRLRVIQRCTAQQWYQSLKGESWPVCGS